MSLPKRSSAYPASLRHAIQVAADLGELKIPCDNPLALRLQFNGLRGALRLENASAQIDRLGFYVQKDPPALVIREKDISHLTNAVQAAIDAAQADASTLDDAAAEAAFLALSNPKG